MLKANSLKLFLTFLFLIPYFFAHSQTLEGTTGLFFIPTAEMPKDGTVTFGVSFINKELVSFSGYQQNALTPYLTVTFLPFAEVSLKITRNVDLGVGDQALGDRTFSTRIRIVEEKDITPAIILGLHDMMAAFGGTEAIHNNALYLVGTKNLNLPYNIINSISLHAGYGLDILQARTHNFVGLFGGIDIKFFNTLELMTEYDGKRPNVGFRIKLFNHISLLGGYINYKHFSGGVSFSFQL